ncbi:putative cytochrome P450 oxygenase [Aspergillus candidus]|uniref:Cytochrome P450 n=1 Tax=Aspergillus candidus TaxID=41067 RepID=A0A2I2F985_ASPCN|nr:cytochrome P450 [Aspergillus candidus]PLB37197.1 cytochrome P450 [Aspergillus candidus]
MDTSYLSFPNIGLDLPLYGIVIVAITSAFAIQALYRLYFHPLAKIPGPKLTAISSLYEFYYDVICGGRFLFQIEKMHEQYGPIVRINPREIHIIDPEFYHEIYAPSTRKRDKEPSFVSTYGVPYAMASTVKHDHHRYRRGLLNDFFSKRSVLSLSPVIEARVERLMDRFQEFHENGRVVNICNTFGALTSDIITHYCYGKHWGFLEDEEFRSDIRTATNDFTAFSHANRFFPFLTPLLRSVPTEIMALLMPGKAALFAFERSIFQHFSAVIQGKVFTLTGDHNIVKRLHSPEIPAEERTLSRLQDEGFTFLIAGTETTMRALSFATYYVYQDPKRRGPS